MKIDREKAEQVAERFMKTNPNESLTTEDIVDGIMKKELSIYEVEELAKEKETMELFKNMEIGNPTGDEDPPHETHYYECDDDYMDYMNYAEDPEEDKYSGLFG